MNSTGINKEYVTSDEIAERFKMRKHDVKRSIKRHNIEYTEKTVPIINDIGVITGYRSVFIVSSDVIDLFKNRSIALQRCCENVSLKTIEQIKGIKLLRQYSVCGKYRIDGYDPVNNVAYEIDERHHFTPQQMDADRIREEEIKAVLGCEFIRIRV
ncbi:TPA: hypothetical protein JS341_001719 [Escherichia coli]|nr:hypothetical protein [Escherichia coli]